MHDFFGRSLNAETSYKGGTRLNDSSRAKIETLDKFFPRHNVVVAVSHTNYLRETTGGVEKLIKIEENFCKDNIGHYVQIFPLKSYGVDEGKIEWNQLVGVNVDNAFVGYFTIKQLSLYFERLRKIGQIDVLAILFHHLLGFFLKALSILEASLQPRQSYIYIHDFYTICPQYNLLKNKVEYCGSQPFGSETCEDCSYNDARKKMASEMKDFIYRFRGRFVFPAESTKKIWLSVYKGLEKNCLVVPHQKVLLKQSDSLDMSTGKIKIGYIGAQAFHKGYPQWKEIVNKYKENYEFYHLGSLQERLSGVTFIPVSVLKQGDEKMVETMRDQKIDIAFLWSIWPETYSFTFFESLTAGCFILTNVNSGNIAAQIKQYNCGKSFDELTGLSDYLSDVNQVRMDIKLYKDDMREYQLVNNHSLLESLIEDSKLNIDYLSNSNNVSCEWSDIKLLEGKILHEIEHADQIISLIAAINELKNKLRSELVQL